MCIPDKMHCALSSLAYLFSNPALLVMASSYLDCDLHRAELSTVRLVGLAPYSFDLRNPRCGMHRHLISISRHDVKD